MGFAYSVYIANYTSTFMLSSIFTAVICHPIQMVGVETIWELHTLTVMSS